MIQALIGPIANLAGSWMESKVEQTKAKGAVAKARAEAEAQVMVTAATHEAGWEKIMAILVIIIIAMCFIPFTQPYVERGFEALSRTPEWFQWAMYASIGASFGIRGLKGFKK